MLTPINVNYPEVESIGSLSKYNKLVLDYFVHMGYLDLYKEFTKDLDIPTDVTPLFLRRSKIRDLIESGEMDLCTEELNNLDIEILKNKEIFVHVTCHKAYEMKGKLGDVEIIKYLREYLGEIALEYEEEISTLLEYLIFNSKELEIQEMREHLADLVNNFIISFYNTGDNELMKMIEGIVIEEDFLSQKNRFMEFKDRILEN